MEFYCVKCKAKKDVEVTEKSVTKNNREMFKSVCPDCNTKLCRIGGVVKKDAE